MDLFVIVWFILFFGIIIKNIARFVENENSPVLTVYSTVVATRRKTHHHNHNGSMHTSHSYHVTFELADGQRMELKVKRQEFRELTEGMRGMLTYQGTRFKGFAP